VTSVYLQAPAIFAPGLDDWSVALPVLRGESPYHYAPLPCSRLECLPPQERRRSSASTRLALQVAQASLTYQPINESLAAIFASANGDTEIHHHICSALTEPQPLVSPMRFHNSVHNAPAGYWGIANQNHAPTNSIAAYDGSFAAGLLTAATQAISEARHVLLVAYDLPFLPPLDQQRPISEPFAMALQLTPEPTAASLAVCQIEATTTAVTAPTLTDPALERLHSGNPAARALPLLLQLAHGKAGTINLDYLDGLSLQLTLNPC